MVNMSKKVEEERKSGQMEFEGGKERVAVVCNRISCDFPSRMSERLLEEGFEHCLTSDKLPSCDCKRRENKTYCKATKLGQKTIIVQKRFSPSSKRRMPDPSLGSHHGFGI